MLMQAPVAIVVFRGSNHIIELANDLYLSIAGKSREILLNKPAFEVMPKAASQGFIEILNGVRESGQPYSLNEHRTVIERNGREDTAWLNIVYQPLKELDGTVDRIMIMVTDVTEQVLTRYKKEEAEALVSKTMSHLELSISIGHIGTWHWDIKNDIVVWSKEQLELYGITEKEFGGKISDFHLFVLPEDMHVVKGTAPLEKSRQGDYEYQFRIKRKDGETRWIQGRSRSFYNEAGELESRMGVNIDITSQKQAEEKAHENEQRFRTLAEALPQLIWMTDNKGTYEYASHQWNEYSGLDPMSANFWQELVHEEDIDTMLNGWRTCLVTGETYRSEARLKNKEGHYRWHLVTGEPVRNEQGEITNWIGALTDIHHQKTFAQNLEAEVQSRTAQLLLKNEELQEQKEFIETILDSSEDIIAVLDRDLNYLSVNKKVEEHYGLKRESFTGRNLFEIFPYLKDSPMPGLLQRAFNGESFSVNEYKSAVTDHWYQTYYVPLKKSDGSVYGVVVVGHDITDVMLAAERLKEKNIELQDTKSFLQQLIDSSVEFISVLDKNLDYITVNKKFEETLNWSREDLRGRSVFEVNPRLEGTAQLKCIERALLGETIYLDKRPSVVRPDIYVDTYFIPLRLQDKIEGVIIMARDVTAIVKTETLLEQKNQELLRSNEDLLQFAHVASHDLKEPVRKIRTFGSRLHAEYKELLPERAIGYISKMENAASRMYDMIDGVLLFSSLTNSEQPYDEIDLNEMMRNIQSDLELLIQQKEATIICDPLPVIHGSSVLIYQLFSNLVNNSLKFSTPGTKPVIQVRSLTREGQNQAVITIEDNGIGFNQEQTDKIFKTFSRLHSKERFEGTGLGLALCKKIVERHGGQITAESEEGKGAKFIITLPQRISLLV